MHIVFLGARLPLTKTFFTAGGPIHTTPYPHVARVTSYSEQVNTLADLHAQLLSHAAQGHCLFGGRLTSPLNYESRAGKTLKAPREWVVFDFDKVDAKNHIDVVAKYLPPECQNVSYIAQASASMYRPDTTKWSGHIFMLLKTPVDEHRVKQWFEWVNFNVKALSQQISLSDSQQALHWPLDRSAAYCSKLIYIAPPKCTGFEPAVDKPFELVKKKQPSLSIPDFTPIDSVMVRTRINELRRSLNLAEIDYRTKEHEGVEIMLSAGECDVHGIKNSGDHYIRFNLNGGDSYAYFIDLRAPELIKNFKGEPYLKTEEAAPELWKVLRSKAKQIVQKPPLNEGSEVLAFYATNQGSKVTVGMYDPIEQKLELNQASETSARAWMAEFGMFQKGFLPHYNLKFNPQSDVVYVPGCIEINTFVPTRYMTKVTVKNTPTLKDLPPLTNKILRSVLGDPDDVLLAHFINWLACIMQYRCQTGTAWVLSGRTGTGKGSLLKFILHPLLGQKHVRAIQMPLLMTDFNAFIDGSLLVAVEESDTRIAGDHLALLHAKLKHYITDSPVEINQKKVATYQAENFSNWVFFANERTPVFVSGDDRRYNIAPRQEQQIIFTPNEYLALQRGDELEAFAKLLMVWPASEAQASRIIQTAAHDDVHEATTPINQLIAEAIMEGDLQFFIERTPTGAETIADFNNRFNPINIFNTLIDRCLEDAKKKRHTALTEEDLFVLFRTLIPDERYFQDSKTWRRRHFKSLGLDVSKRQRHPDNGEERIRGVITQWQLPEDEPAAKPTKNDDVVVPIKKGKKQ